MKISAEEEHLHSKCWLEELLHIVDEEKLISSDTFDVNYIGLRTQGRITASSMHRIKDEGQAAF